MKRPPSSSLSWSCLALLLPLAAPMPAGAQTLQEAQSLLRSGEYEEALDAYRDLTRGEGSSSEALRGYVGALLEVARYEDAIEVATGGASGGARGGAGSPGPTARSPELENLLGEAFYSVGRIDEAEAAFRRSMDAGAPDRHTARLNLGILQWRRGEREEALATFDSFIDLYNTARRRLGAADLMTVGRAVQYLGITSSVLFQDALMAFEEAAQADPGDPEPPLLIGELYLDKYRATDAREAIRPVLEANPHHPRALLDQARILDFEGVGGAVALVEEALEVAPDFVEARSFLAGLYLKVEERTRALEEAERALEVNPADLDALSVLAAAHFLASDTAGYDEIRARVQVLNPSYTGLYLTVADLAVTQRLYATAVDLAARAVALDSTSWRGYGILGMNQLRTGAVDEGRRNLEIAFAGDPYNPWYKNSLDLMDTFGHYEKVETEHFEIFIHEREAELLGPPAAKMAEEAYAGLRDRYGAEPPTPVRVEIYPSHADFSVRTLGITGLGALGVSFGSTLVLDSPSARDPGEFSWASTMWHEVAHAFHLAMSDHRVPRWFTEGLAVHEQHKARPDWGTKASPAWLQAYAGDALFPVSEMNEGFVRPRFPEQVIFSYYQASLVFELIESQWGLDSILAMLEGYREGKPNEQVFQEVLGESPREFDKTFDDYIQRRFGERIQAVTEGTDEESGAAAAGIFHGGGGSPEALRLQVMEHPRSFLLRLAFGRALFEAERFDEAEKELQEALRLFPEYGGPDGPYLYLARIHKDRGELEPAARALHQLGRLNEALAPVHVEEAGIWMELGRTEEAARALEKAVEITPFEMQWHRDLAGLYEELEDYDGAVRERRAILALGPTDRADAHYRLARALARAGEAEEARTEVLRALEIAPTYDVALELLLELRGGRP